MNNYQLSVKKYSVYKDSAISWLGDVPEHWEVKRVKDIVKRIGNGVTPRGGSEVYTDFGVVFLRSQNVYDDGLRIDNVSFIPEKIHEEMKSSQLETGDILINITGASIGRTCLFSLESGSANINQHIAFLRTKFWINEFYISLFLKSHFIKNYIEIEQNGASKEAFNLSQIANIPLVLPSQLEQKSIATYLDTKTAQCDRKIDLLTQKATQYGKLKQSLINETVTRGLDKSVAMKDSAIGVIPKHWEIKRLKELLISGNLGIRIGPFGSSLKSEIMKNQGYKIYGQEHVINDNFIMGNKYIDEFKFKELQSYEILPNDLLVTMMGTVGKSKIVPEHIERGIMDSHLIRIRIDKSLFIPSLLALSINESIYIHDQRKILTKGSIMEGLNSKIIKALNIAIPPLSEQKAIADYLDTKTAQIDQIIQTINTQIEKLKELRKTLINDVVTGKIKVIDN